MIISEEPIQLKEWGNGNAFRISKKMLQLVDFDDTIDYELKAIDENGVKKLVIEPKMDLEEKLAIFEEFSGLLDSKIETEKQDYRKERREERLSKYESLT
ncbi:hypothetical protein [Streptococcus oricebi]|uniref:Uncharacterized protein n=1 Tax=Streptococcus oricebi TaxID=1547447 RepID=A0ABS5B215_9STRE|nr:hypothetical protein [Streptococcus oricebi]MBP2622805.1 hypothetical protein [Streptococcus oricebi]